MSFWVTPTPTPTLTHGVDSDSDSGIDSGLASITSSGRRQKKGLVRQKKDL